MNKYILVTKPKNYVVYLRPHGKLLVEREREREYSGLWLYFYWGKVSGPRVLRAHSSLVNLNYKSGSLSSRRERGKTTTTTRTTAKTNTKPVVQMVSYQK